MKLPFLPEIPSEGLAVVSKFPLSVDDIVKAGGGSGGAQKGTGGDLEPRGSEIKSAH